MGVYDEWTVIYDPGNDASEASEALIQLVCDAALRATTVSLTDAISRAESDSQRYELERWPGHHYRFLTALAEIVDAKSIVEIGTYAGASALSFLAAPCVEEVVSYDIVPWRSIDSTLLIEADFSHGLQQCLSDLSDPVEFGRSMSVLSKADIVFLDGPKDGRFEQALLDRLLAMKREKPQLLIIDDVRVNTMVKTWRSLPLPKIDATSFGHWSGTGLVWLPSTE